MLHSFNQDVDALDVKFLNAIGEGKFRSMDNYVGNMCEVSFLVTGKNNDAHSFNLGGLGSKEHVPAVARSADCKKNVACTAQTFDIARENVVVTEIVGNAGEMCRI